MMLSSSVKRYILCISIMCLLSHTAAAQILMPLRVMGNGGVVSSAPNLRFHGTVSQTAIGVTNNSLLRQLGGFWYQVHASSPAPAITTHPIPLDFGVVIAGLLATDTLVVGNTGTATLSISDINTITPNSFFTVVDTAFSVTPGDSHIVSITLLSHDPATVSDTLSILSNDDARPVLHIPVGGRAVLRGDVNRDDKINVLDIIILVRILIGKRPTPLPGSSEFLVADANGDGTLNIQDVVYLVNRILGIPMKILTGSAKPVRVSLGEAHMSASGQLVIPIMLDTDIGIAGMQISATVDSARIVIGTPQRTEWTDTMWLENYMDNGILRMVIYSSEGMQIPKGNGVAFLVPVTVQDGTGSTPATFTLSEVILATSQAQRIPVIYGTTTVRIVHIPSTFALNPNRPNPFNPTTQIAYDIPQQAHVVLAVYNTLGQEVVRLVDESKAPGRYVVTWDGRNGQGGTVSSGVYLYRLTSSTGFSQSRRMTLLK